MRVVDGMSTGRYEWIARLHRVRSGDRLPWAGVSPTVLRLAGFRFYFFSREETRMHVHVFHAEGEAKFWLEPRVELAANYGMSRRRVATALRLVRENEDAIRKAWQGHFIG